MKQEYNKAVIAGREGYRNEKRSKKTYMMRKVGGRKGPTWSGEAQKKSVTNV